jgi:predicted small integral membrane protein
VNDVPANIAAGTSVASASLAWMAQANEIASFLASVVAIVAGIFAIVHYYRALRR